MKNKNLRSGRLFLHHTAAAFTLICAAILVFGSGLVQAANNFALTFTGSGTWTCPGGVSSVQVECWGGGGAGGSAVRPSGSGTETGGGGAGGAYARLNSFGVTPGTTYTITVGAGGISSIVNGAAVAGGDSWFNNSSTVLAKGGAGGVSTNGILGNNFGPGGVGTATGSIGDVVNAGGSGATSSVTTFGGGGGGSGGTASVGNSASTSTGLGGTAVAGGGNGGNANPTSGTSAGGQAPTIPPGGGGGGARSAATTQQTGGTGAGGQLVLTYALPGAIYRADTSGNLNTTGDWAGGAVPASTNFAAWDSAVATPANCTNALGADLSWHGISIGTPGAAVNITSGNTLTLGASYDLANGIDMGAAGQNLTLGCGLLLAPGDEKWNVVAGRTLDASSVTLARSLGATVDFSSSGTIKIGNANVNSIVGGWATVDGAGWAAVTASTIAPLASYTAAASAAGATDNLDVTTANASTSIAAGCNSIRFSATSSGFKINAGGSPQVVASGGILVRNGVTATLLSSSASGSLREIRGSSGGDLILNTVGSGAFILGAATIGTGSSDNSPITISDNATATGLTKSGSGKATLYGVGTYTGNTRINQGTFALASYANGTVSTLSGTTNIYVESGATFDVTANTNTLLVSGFTVGPNQRLEGLGTVNGNLTISNIATAKLFPGNNGTAPAYGTLTIKSNLTVGALAKVQFDLGSSTSSGNDKIVLDAVNGTLNGNGATITINQFNGNNTLATADYVLFDLTGASGSVASSFATTPAWVQTPANAANYNLITVGKQVVLHHTAPADAANSTAAASPTSGVTADGVTTSTITVTARDGGNNILSNANVTATSSGSGNTISTAAITDVNGQTTFTIKSTVAETKTITVTIAGTAITQQPTVGFVPGAVSTANSTAVASPTGGVTADGSSTSTITITAKDANNNLISGATVSASATGSGNTLSSPANTDGSGQSTYTIASTVAQTKTNTITIAGTQIIAQPTVGFVPGAVSTVNSTAVPSLTTVSADGISTSTITVTALDANNNPISGATVSAASTGSGNTLSTPANTGAGGQTTFTIASSVAEVKTITVTIAGTAITQQPVVTFQVSVSPTLSTASASPTTGITADNSATSSITVTAIDVSSNPIPGATVVVTSSGTGNTISTAAPTDGSGVTTATILTTVAETKTLTVTINGGAIVSHPAVTFVPGAVSATNSAISPATATKIADGSSTQIVTVQARDVFNNNRSTGGDTVVFSATSGTVGSTTDNGDGTYSATWTSPTSVGSGTATVTATLGGTDAGTAVGASSSVITLTPGAATQVRVETAANGSGSVVGAQSFYSGASTTVFAIVRDANNNFITNEAATAWSLTGNTGGVVAGDLVASGNSKSATFSAHLAGTATIHVTSAALTPGDSGLQTVIQPYYKSATSGNWNVPATWLWSDTFAGAYTTATNTPTSLNTAGVTVQATHTVTVSNSVTVDFVTVAANGTLNVSSGKTLTIATGGGTDLDVFGTVLNTGTVAVTGTPVMAFEAASLYQHNQNTGVIPTATWNLTSTCEITGVATSTSGPSGGLGQTFGNFKWNCPNQSASCNINGGLTTVNGDFTVASTGTGILRGAGVAGVTLTVGGNLRVQGGTYELGNNNPTLNQLTVTNDIVISSGARLDYKNSGTSGGIYTINVYGNLTVSGTGTLTKGSANGTASFNFIKAGTQVVAIDSTATIGGAIGWTVSGSTILDLGTSIIAGAGSGSSFANSAGSTLKLGSPGGIAASGATGNIQTLVRTYDGTSTYIYNGTAAQVTGTGLPATVSNLTIANTAASVALSQNVSVSGTLNINASANLDFNTKTVTTPNAPVFNGGLTMEVVKTGANNFTGSKLTQSAGTITYGGTLFVTNTGSALAPGDSIPLFVAPAYAGGFSSVTGPVTPVGLSRDASQLTGGTGGNIVISCDGSLIASAAANTTNCSGASYSLNGSAAGGGGSYTYSWVSSPLGFTSSSANPLVSPTVTTTYTLTVTDGNGCTAPALVTVTVYPTPTITLGSSPSASYGSTSANLPYTATANGANQYAILFDAAAHTAGFVDVSLTALPASPIGITVPGNAAVAVYNGTLLANNSTTGCTDSGTAFTVTITPASLTVAANSTSKVYGQTVTFAGTELTTSGLTNGDTVTSVTLTSAGATNPAAVGGYPIVASAAGGSGLGNYTISYVDGTLTVNPATLCVTANDASRVYGATNPVFTASYSGFVNGETLGSSDVTGAPSLITDADTNSVVGSYTITNLLGSLTSTNYTFSLTNGMLRVAAVAITVTADNQSRSYGAANPTFTASYAGLVNGDTIAVVSGSPSLTTDADSNNAPGSYVITNLLGNLSATNYSFTLVNGTLAVGQASLGITANNDSKTYDGLGYTGGNGIAYSGFVNGETPAVLGGSLSYGGSSQNATNAGSYSIVPSGQTSANYAISYTNGTLTVNALGVAVTADAQTKVYGTADPALIYAFAPALISGDSFSGGLIRTMGEGVGSYAINQGSLSLSANYTLAYNGTNLVITPAALNVMANKASKNYGQTVTFAGTEFTTTGLANGDSVTSVTLTSAGATNTAPVASYPIVASAASGSGLGNYTISYVDGTLTVNAATPVVINGPTVLGDGTMQLNFTGGDNGVSYRIQASTDLASPVWSDLITNVAGIGGLPVFIDTDATNLVIRFYRTVTP